jgi:hypothetical protein
MNTLRKTVSLVITHKLEAEFEEREAQSKGARVNG